MHVIRPVSLQDINGVDYCAQKAGLGLTHLPKERHLLKAKIQNSIDAFAKYIAEPKCEDYFFVLAESNEEKILGTCAIYSKIGCQYPFDVFKIEKNNNETFLRLKSYRQGPSEVGALYLLPDVRGGGLGKLLSLSRFLFIASHQQRFDSQIIANMRGVIEDGHSAFWDAIGYHSRKVPFHEIMSQRLFDEAKGVGIFSNEPIQVSSLPEDAQKILGKIHPHTEPALKMLLREGFHISDEVDPFDGGPILKAMRQELRTVKLSLVSQVKAVTEKSFIGDQAIVCNGRLDFRACYATLAHSTDGHVTLSSDVAEALQVKPNDFIRYIAL